MGTKRPSCTVFDTLSNINTSDRKLQPGGKISRDPSPRPAMTAQSERGERDRGEDWRRERETEKMRDKARYKDMDPRDRTAPAPRPREGEREWRERERRQEDDRSRNGRPLSNQEKETLREVEKGMKKGDTFPRMRKSSPARGRGMAMDEERGERRQRDRPKRLDPDDWERERERERQRERYREREREGSRGKVEGKSTLGRPAEDEKSRKRERYPGSDFQDRRREKDDLRDRRERDTGRKREKPRGEREIRVSSPHRRRDVYEREKREKKERRRDTRSEGDSDERELKRERVRDRERQELTYQHSRSEGDNKGKTERERERRGHRDEDRQKYKDKEGDRSRRKGGEKERERYREGDRWKGSDDRREEDRYREQRRAKERERDDTAGRSSRPQNETALRVPPPRAQSSGEWSSDMDSEMRQRRDRDSYEERESGRESTAESDRDVEERSQRSERERGDMTEQRRMWLEPQRGKNSKDEVVGGKERGVESQAGWEREGRRVKEEPDERYSDQSSYRGRHRGDLEGEGVCVDGEEVWGEADKGGKEQLSDSDGGIEGSRRRDAEGESVTDNTEESDREEEGGSDYWGRSESEGGSDTGWRQERGRVLSGEDGFVTMSSGGDEEDEREEEEFKDCQESWEGGDDEEREEEDEEEDEEREKKPKYVFCVIGQTLPRNKSQGGHMGGVERDVERSHQGGDEVTQQPQDDLHPTVSINNQDAERKSDGERSPTGEIRCRVPQVPGEGMRGKAEHPYAEIGTIKRDSQTEKLLIQWREINQKGEREQGSPIPSNPYGDVCSEVTFDNIQPLLEGIASGAMSPEEVEAIRIRMSGAWSMSDEPKRHSQAPHLKWAKNVVREILGQSEENAVDGAEQEEVAQGGGVVVKLEEEEEPELELEEEEEPVEMEGLRGMGQSRVDMHADQLAAMHDETAAYTHADTLLDTEGKEDKETGHLQLEKAAIDVRISEEEGDKVTLSEMEKQAARREEVEMYLSVSNTLYKPNSCPILNYDTDPSEGQEVEDRVGDSDKERQGEEELEEKGAAPAEEDVVDGREGEKVVEKKKVTLTNSCSFRDLGPEARLRRRGIRKTTEKRRSNGELVEVKEEEGVGRDRRTRIFSTTGNKRRWRKEAVSV